MRLRVRSAALGLFASGLLAPPGHAAEDVAAPKPTFHEGEVLSLADVDKLRPFLPAEFWEHRDLVFYAGMQLEIGPPYRDYTPAEAYVTATQQFAGTARLGPESSLTGYTAGQPFPMDAIDCLGDPEAGAKIAWNFDSQWEGGGAQGRFRLTYWDRGEELPLFFEGSVGAFALAHRVEPQNLANGGYLFPRDTLKQSSGISVDAPHESKGLMLQSFRYRTSDERRAKAKGDDTFVYVPSARRVWRLKPTARTDAVAGTDLSFEDLRSFAGVVPEYTWECRGERDLIAPMNSKVAAYPYRLDRDFGPYGVSYANDRWELRHAVEIRQTPRSPDHPYHHKDLYLDAETLVPLYTFAYDREGKLWKIIWHNHRWSGDNLPEDTAPWYAGWKGVETPRDLRVVSDAIANVQTGSATRVEFWDAHGTPLPNRKIHRVLESFRRLIRLTI